MAALAKSKNRNTGANSKRSSSSKSASKSTDKKSGNSTGKQSDKYAGKYADKYAGKYAGKSGKPRPVSKIVRLAANKTFRTEEELDTFILKEGTFKDRVAATVLAIIKRRDVRSVDMLLQISSESKGGDKAHFAITQALKVIEYYNAAKSENPDDEIVRFLDRQQYKQRLTAALRTQMTEGFLKEKTIKLLKSLVERNVMAVEATNLLMENTNEETKTATLEFLEEARRLGRQDLLVVVKEKIVQDILTHKNPKRIKSILHLALVLHKKEWVSNPKDYKKYIVPLIHGYSACLQRVYDTVTSDDEKNKEKLTTVSAVLTGLCRFFEWGQNVTTKTESEEQIQKFMKKHETIIHQLAYHNNIQISLLALSILETANITADSKYPKILTDTMSKYTYLDEIQRCEILNMAANTTSPEILESTIKSSYLAKIGGKYALGCLMVISETQPGLQAKSGKNPILHIIRAGLHLQKRSYDPDVASSSAQLLRGNPISIYNLWT